MDLYTFCFIQKGNKIKKIRTQVRTSIFHRIENYKCLRIYQTNAMYDMLLTILADAAHTAVSPHLRNFKGMLGRRVYEHLSLLCYNYKDNGRVSQYALLEYIFRLLRKDCSTDTQNGLEDLFVKSLCHHMLDMQVDKMLQDPKSTNYILDLIYDKILQNSKSTDMLLNLMIDRILQNPKLIDILFKQIKNKLQK